jgi:hypothetical protein
MDVRPAPARTPVIRAPGRAGARHICAGGGTFGPLHALTAQMRRQSTPTPGRRVLLLVVGALLLGGLSAAFDAATARASVTLGPQQTRSCLGSLVTTRSHGVRGAPLGRRRASARSPEAARGTRVAGRRRASARQQHDRHDDAERDDRAAQQGLGQPPRDADADATADQRAGADDQCRQP